MKGSPISDSALNKILGEAIPRKKKKLKRDRRQIWVSQEVWEHIAKNSQPLVDNVDSTLRRLFGLPAKEAAQEDDS